MKQIILDIVCELVKENGKVVDLQFDDGSRFNTNIFTGLKFEVVNECGSAGGWPEIKLIGHEVDIGLYVMKYYANDDEDFEFIMESVEDYTA